MDIINLLGVWVVDGSFTALVLFIFFSLLTTFTYVRIYARWRSSSFWDSYYWVARDEHGIEGSKYYKIQYPKRKKVVRALLFFVSVVWLIFYLGTVTSFLIFLFIISLLYIFFCLTDNFRTYKRLFFTLVSKSDPRLGYLINNNSSTFDELTEINTDFALYDYVSIADRLNSGGLSFNSSIGTLFPYNYLVRDSTIINNNLYAVSKDPFFFSLILYHYSEFYIYNCIHNFWRFNYNLISYGIGRGSNSSEYFNSFDSFFRVLKSGKVLLNEYRFLKRSLYDSNFYLIKYFKEFSSRLTSIDSITSSSFYILYYTNNSSFTNSSNITWNSYLILPDPFLDFKTKVYSDCSLFSYYMIYSSVFFEFCNYMKSILFSIDLKNKLINTLITSYSFLCYDSSTSSSERLIDFSEFSNFIFNDSDLNKFFYWFANFISFKLKYSSNFFKFKDFLVPINWLDYYFYYINRIDIKPLKSSLKTIFRPISYLFSASKLNILRLIGYFLSRTNPYPLSSSKYYFYSSSNFKFYHILGIAKLELYDYFEYKYVRPFIGIKVWPFQFKSFFLNDSRRSFLDLDYSDVVYNSFYSNTFGFYFLNCITDKYLLNFSGSSNTVLSNYLISSSFISTLINRNANLKKDTLNKDILNYLEKIKFQDNIKYFFSVSPSLISYIFNFVYNPLSSKFFHWILDCKVLKELYNDNRFVYDAIFYFVSNYLKDFCYTYYNNYMSTFYTCDNTYEFTNNVFCSLVEVKELSITSDLVVLRRLFSFSSKKFDQHSSFFLRTNVKRLQARKISSHLIDTIKLIPCFESFWTFLKLRSKGNFFFSNRSIRKVIKLLFQDSFNFYFSNSKIFKSRPTKRIHFRRFFWTKFFVNPIKVLFSLGKRTDSYFETESFLTPFYRWLINNKHLSDEYENRLSNFDFVLANFKTIIRSFLIKKPIYIGYVDKLYKSPLDIEVWHSLLNLLCCDKYFFKFIDRFNVCLSNCISFFSLNNFGSLKTFFFFKNVFMNRLPNKVVNYLVINSHRHVFVPFFGRVEVKRLVVFLNVLIISIFSNLLTFRSGFSSISNVLSMFFSYRDSSMNFSYFSKFFMPLLKQKQRRDYKFINRDFRERRKSLIEDRYFLSYADIQQHRLNTELVPWWVNIPSELHNIIADSFKDFIDKFSLGNNNQYDYNKFYTFNIINFVCFLHSSWSFFCKINFLKFLESDELYFTILSASSRFFIIRFLNRSSRFLKLLLNYFLSEFADFLCLPYHLTPYKNGEELSMSFDLDHIREINYSDRFYFNSSSFYALHGYCKTFFSNKSIIRNSSVKDYSNMYARSRGKFYLVSNPRNYNSYLFFESGFSVPFRQSLLYIRARIDSGLRYSNFLGSETSWFYSIFLSRPEFYHERLVLNFGFPSFSARSFFIFGNILFRFFDINIFWFIFYFFVKFILQSLKFLISYMFLLVKDCVNFLISVLPRLLN